MPLGENVLFLILLTHLSVPADTGVKKAPPPLRTASSEKTAPVRVSPRLGRFHLDFARNFKGLFSRGNLMAAVLGTAGSGGAAGFDQDVADFFRRDSRLRRAQEVGNVLGKTWVLGAAAGAVFMIGEHRDSDSLKRLGYSLGQGLALNGALTFGLKTTVRRPRPNGVDRRSFPSGHASQAFVFATIVSHHHKKATIPAYLTAGLIAASRLDRDAHYLSDIVAGAALGYIVGRTVVRSSQGDSKFSALPFASPSSEAVGVTVRIDWP